MAKVLPNVYGWDAAAAADVEGYYVRVVEAPGAPDYNTPAVDVGNVTSIDFSTLPEFSGVDGTYNLAVSAYDDGGNESDLARLDAVPLDLVPPDAPRNFRRL